ncbi:MAG: hypothetical protein [Caudoviricetes sp.]|nr:MAG: hypothetical protein [Caudoviricetes sp.]
MENFSNKKIVYIYVDDERAFPSHIPYDCKQCYCTNYNEAITMIENYSVSGYDIILDLDHDLGEDKTGYDIAKYVVENNLPLKSFHCHSMNIVGKENIEKLLIHYGYLIF